MSTTTTTTADDLVTKLRSLRTQPNRNRNRSSSSGCQTQKPDEVKMLARELRRLGQTTTDAHVSPDAMCCALWDIVHSSNCNKPVVLPSELLITRRIRDASTPPVKDYKLRKAWHGCNVCGAAAMVDLFAFEHVIEVSRPIRIIKAVRNPCLCARASESD